MKIKTANSGKVPLSSIEYGTVVMYKAFHYIVVNGHYSPTNTKLPIVRLMDGQLVMLPKREELRVVNDVYLTTEEAV